MARKEQQCFLTVWGCEVQGPVLAHSALVHRGSALLCLHRVEVEGVSEASFIRALIRTT